MKTIKISFKEALSLFDENTFINTDNKSFYDVCRTPMMTIKDFKEVLESSGYQHQLYCRVVKEIRPVYVYNYNTIVLIFELEEYWIKKYDEDFQ